LFRDYVHNIFIFNYYQYTVIVFKNYPALIIIFNFIDLAMRLLKLERDVGDFIYQNDPTKHDEDFKLFRENCLKKLSEARQAMDELRTTFEQREKDLDFSNYKAF
jgi:hypothetical protein